MGGSLAQRSAVCRDGEGDRVAASIPAVTRPVDDSARAPDPNPGYAAFHAPRFAFVVELARRYLAPGARILDVGWSPLTAILAERLGVVVDALGLEPDGALPHGRQYHFDLNDAAETAEWRRDLGRYDIVIFAEVIEHLHRPPELALAYLRELVRPGGVLIVQTPNAASIGKRLKLLAGRNPFERIRADRSNPGHFREYTAAELAAMLTQAGFRVEEVLRRFYFDARFGRHLTGREPPAPIKGALQNIAYRLLPPSLREGITAVARRE
jgi:2-polyprenyl-3-methyl-5-hydroxy-6-metoxy-1,4-benzoquinol methylase